MWSYHSDAATLLPVLLNIHITSSFMSETRGDQDFSLHYTLARSYRRRLKHGRSTSNICNREKVSLAQAHVIDVNDGRLRPNQLSKVNWVVSTDDVDNVDNVQLMQRESSDRTLGEVEIGGTYQ